jgi:hypothetical protein
MLTSQELEELIKNESIGILVLKLAPVHSL